MKALLILLLSARLCASEAEIRRRLNQWPEDFNAGNAPAACALFAPDLVASYPGSEDRDFAGMCETLKKVVKGAYKYDKPEIEQILLEGDLAVVRLIWTLREGGKTTREKGLDVFRRQKDGSWKIAISYAYPLSE